jgi:hypothetical protein
MDAGLTMTLSAIGNGREIFRIFQEELSKGLLYSENKESKVKSIKACEETYNHLITYN